MQYRFSVRILYVQVDSKTFLLTYTEIIKSTYVDID